MEVHVVNPHGYCQGVHAAIAIALKAKEDYPDRDVYMLGLLVHNEETMEYLSAKGLIPLDETEKPILDHILDRKKGDVVVFSAHGHPAAYEDLARDKGLIVVDATCRYVQENLLAALSSPPPIIYLGVAGHLESEAFLANCPDANFYDVKGGRCDLLRAKGQGKDPLVVTQTTLSGEEIDAAMGEIRKIFPNARLLKSRCLATQMRQDAMAHIPEDVDAVIVLGSNRSNNSLKLAEIAKAQGFTTHLCLGLEQVKSLDLRKTRKLALSSGASTSNQTFQEVLSYLRSVPVEG